MWFYPSLLKHTMSGSLTSRAFQWNAAPHMDVETSAKKKQMFILKISRRLVCGPKPDIKGNVGFDCKSSRMVTYRLSMAMKNCNESLNNAGGYDYNMNNTVIVWIILLLVVQSSKQLNVFFWSGLSGSDPRVIIILNRASELYISTRLASSWRRKNQ